MFPRKMFRQKKESWRGPDLWPGQSRTYCSVTPSQARSVRAGSPFSSFRAMAALYGSPRRPLGTVILSPPYSATNADRANTPRMRPSWHAGSARLGTYTGTPPCERHSVSAAVCPITSSSSGRLTHVSAMCISSTVIRGSEENIHKISMVGEKLHFWADPPGKV